MKKINKQSVETFKTVVIAILITAVIAFVAGMQYANKQNAKVEAAVKEVAKTQVVEAPKEQPSKQ